MKRSRSLATAAGVTLAVAGAVSALFLTVGAGASSLGQRDSSSSDSSSTVPTTPTTATTADDLSDAEVYTLDENGRLIPFEERSSYGGTTTTSPGRADRYDDSYHDDRYEGDDSYHDDDDRYDDHDDDDSYHDYDDRYDDHDDEGYDDDGDDDHYDDDRYEDDDDD